MSTVTGSFLTYDDIIRIEYECEMVAEHDVWELRKVNDVRVFVGDHRVYDTPELEYDFYSEWLYSRASSFYEKGCEPDETIDIHAAIERDAIERLKDSEPDFDIPDGRGYE